MLTLFSLFSHPYVPHPALLSFPTRRSSDLRAALDGRLLPLPVRAARPRRAGALGAAPARRGRRSEEHTSELQSPCNLVCRLLLEKKKNTNSNTLHSITYIH